MKISSSRLLFVIVLLVVVALLSAAASAQTSTSIFTTADDSLRCNGGATECGGCFTDMDKFRTAEYYCKKGIEIGQRRAKESALPVIWRVVEDPQSKSRIALCTDGKGNYKALWDQKCEDLNKRTPNTAGTWPPKSDAQVTVNEIADEKKYPYTVQASDGCNKTTWYSPTVSSTTLAYCSEKIAEGK